MATSKQSISLSTLASTVSSLLVLIPVLWFIGKPLISEALAEDIKDIVKEEVEPINNAFTVLLQRDITALRKEIASLRFRQRTGEDWTEEDAEYLTELEIELDALREARDNLDEEESE